MQVINTTPQTDAWIVEFGLWQDDEVQLATFDFWRSRA